MPREYQVISTHDHIIEPPASSTAVSPRSSRIGRRSSRLDADGNLRLADRTKEMYIRGGYNVYPVEVEAVLHEHPKVDLVAVVGVPDEVFGEKGTAFVVPTNPADPPSADELRAFVASHVADYKVPDDVRIRAELPLTSIYKVDKRELLAELLDAVPDLDVVADVETQGVQGQPHGSRR